MSKNDWQQGELKDVPIEVIAKMLERQKEQGNGSDLKELQRDKSSKRGFIWQNTVEKYVFWDNILNYKEYDLFFKRYPKYKIYELWR